MVCSDQFAVFIIIITNQNPYMFLPRLVTQSSFLSVLSVTTLFSFINQWEGQGICMPAVTCCCICIHCSKIRTVEQNRSQKRKLYFRSDCSFSGI